MMELYPGPDKEIKRPLCPYVGHQVTANEANEASDAHISAPGVMATSSQGAALTCLPALMR